MAGRGALRLLRLANSRRMGSAGRKALAAAARRRLAVTVVLDEPEATPELRESAPLLDEAQAAKLQRSMPGVLFVLFTTAGCADCATLEEFWAKMAQAGPGRIFAVSCAATPRLCTERGVDPASGIATFAAWHPGGGMTRYEGPRNAQGVVDFVQRLLEGGRDEL